MDVRIDLHTHSAVSDGTDSPTELVRLAAESGLDVLALTDHDTTAGWAEATEALPPGLSLVPGAELSCEAVSADGWKVSVHVLAYLFDPAAPALAEAEQRRQDEEHRRQQRREDRERREKAKKQRRRERATARRQRRQRIVSAITEHMPIPGIPVVAVSLVVGWGGQMTAALALGMSWSAPGVPVITEGMTLTLAGMTAHAISQRRPHARLLAYTCASGITAAATSASGHLIEDHSPAGMYRAGMYAAASLAGLVLWLVVMRARRQDVSRVSAEEVARWRRLRRRHPILTHRANRLADVTGRSRTQAWEIVWRRTHGAAPTEPTTREIRAERRAAWRRAQAEGWDGSRRGWLRGRDTESLGVVPGPETETVTTPVPEVVTTPQIQWLPAGWETATTRFPQGREPVSASGGNRSASGRQDAAQPTGDGAGTAGGDHGTEPRDAVATERLETVRGMVAAVVADGGDLMRQPSTRAVRKQLGCRSQIAAELLATVLAEYDVTRPTR